MSRAGREPAEDLKRRFVAVCQEVGLEVLDANMHLIRQVGSRVIHVGAARAGWQHECPMISLMASMPVTGDWPESADIRCCATDDDPLKMSCPWMKGRDKVPMAALVQELQETLREREEVVAAIKMGIPGPYRFERTVWKTWNV